MKKILQIALVASILALILLSIPTAFMVSDMSRKLDSLAQRLDNIIDRADTLEDRVDTIENTLNENYPQETISTMVSPSNQDVSFNSTAQNNEEDIEVTPKQADNNYDATALANKALMYYKAGEFDGTPTIIDEQLVSIDEDDGELVINGKHVTPSSFCYRHSIDLPDELPNAKTQVFILGDGTYRLENNSIVKYSKGEKVKLAGGTLDWTGMDIENYRPFVTEFCYDEFNDKLYLIASSIPYDFNSKELKDNVGIYLYLIPDRSKSELEFISQIKYTVEDDDYIFDKSTNPIIKDFLYIEQISEFEFDWWTTFARGYIVETEEFPEGTFTHPVVTTPYVSLSQYKG